VSVLSLQQADIFRVLQSGNTKWFITGINLLLVVWIASLLAALTWGLVTPQGNIQMDDIKAGPLAVETDPNAQLVRQLPGWHLMGVAAQGQAAVVVNTPIDAPDTRLKLVLRGVYVSDESRKARAIIADPKGKEEQYALGDMLPGNAELSEVYPDRVILQRNGRYETLRLDPGSKSKVRTISKSPAKTPMQRYEKQVREIRQKLKKGPKTLIQVVRPTPLLGVDGAMIGYTLQPGREPDLFNGLGLLPGDVVVQINDIRLDSNENGMRALRGIQSSKDTSMTILRDGQEQVMNFKMPDG